MFDLDHRPVINRLKVTHSAIGNGRRQKRHGLQVLERQYQRDSNMRPSRQHDILGRRLESHSPHPFGP